MAGSIWCADCGLNLKQQASLPTQEQFEASQRETQWLAAEAEAAQQEGERAAPAETAGTSHADQEIKAQEAQWEKTDRHPQREDARVTPVDPRDAADALRRDRADADERAARQREEEEAAIDALELAIEEFLIVMLDAGNPGLTRLESGRRKRREGWVIVELPGGDLYESLALLTGAELWMYGTPRGIGRDRKTRFEGGLKRKVEPRELCRGLFGGNIWRPHATGIDAVIASLARVVVDNGLEWPPSRPVE